MWSPAISSTGEEENHLPFPPQKKDRYLQSWFNYQKKKKETVKLEVHQKNKKNTDTGVRHCEVP
jgi:hypothetical protein